MSPHGGHGDVTKGILFAPENYSRRSLNPFRSDIDWSWFDMVYALLVPEKLESLQCKHCNGRYRHLPAYPKNPVSQHDYFNEEQAVVAKE
ncbi:uncharacterized tatc-like protein ymf16 [Phtheirospermum japonicum]|uniref:Uncharacterized tatc-like protein ymf16 n=1 Tax=Phtheirospermum japonicum TaxID=374723 RepID=A0A830DA98_9LAMI|nr:uncharacterized tatc-like protein ymf16 [Phtheirospermum japonicum]